MIDACAPFTEHERIEALARYQILDTEPEQEYDDLVELASAICGIPVVILSFLDRDHQWYKASVGFPRLTLDRTLTFCNHTIQQTEMLIVPDATCDPRFADNPFVTGNAHVRFYAGMPLLTEEGHALGTLCVVDTEPRQLSSTQKRALEALGRQAMSLLELRRRTACLEQSLAESNSMQTTLRQSEERLRAVIAGAPLILFSLDAEGIFTVSEGKGLEVLGLQPGEAVGRSVYEMYADAPDVLEQLKRAYEGQAFSALCDVGPLAFELWYSPVLGDDGHVTSIIGVAYDITKRREAEAALKSSEARFQAFMDNSPTSAYVKDSQGRFVYINDAFRQMSGLLEQNCLGKTTLEILPGPFGERIHAETLETLKNNCLSETMYHFPSPNGGEAWLDWLGLRFTFWDTQGRQFMGFLGLNVTEQKRAEEQSRSAQQELEKTLSQLHATLESTADGLLVVDAQGQVLCVNGVFCEMMKFSDEMTRTRDDSRMLAYVTEQVSDPAAFLARVVYLYMSSFMSL